jgi:hypothetical protein
LINGVSCVEEARTRLPRRRQKCDRNAAVLELVACRASQARTPGVHLKIESHPSWWGLKLHVFLGKSRESEESVRTD